MAYLVITSETPRRADMSTDQEERNQQTYHHFHDAINSGDLQVIGKAIDEEFTA